MRLKTLFYGLILSGGLLLPIQSCSQPSSPSNQETQHITLSPEAGAPMPDRALHSDAADREAANAPARYIPSVLLAKRPTRGEYLAQQALTYVGAPYHWGGASPSVGFDCSGLVYYVCTHCGIQTPHTFHEMWRCGAVVPHDRMQPGDLVFLKDTYKPGLSHVGIYIGDNRFVNAGDEKSGVMISELGPENMKHWAGARRMNLSQVRLPGEKLPSRHKARSRKRRAASQ